MRPAPLLVLTDRFRCTRRLTDVIGTAVDCGARAVVLREKDLAEAERRDLAEELRAMLEPVGGVLICAGRCGEAVHLSAADAFPDVRPSMVGRSCHCAAEVTQAAAEGCDYVTVSPVFLTASKPGYGPALDVDGLARLARHAPAAYALGGVQPADVGACLAAGAYGVAVMGPVMADPRLVAAYLSALQAVPA